MACAPSEDSDQTGHLPSLIRVFPVWMKKAWFLSYPLSAQQRLWSESSLGAHAILLVLPWDGSDSKRYTCTVFVFTIHILQNLCSNSEGIFMTLAFIKPSRVARSNEPPPGMQTVAVLILSPKTFFRGDWSWNNFYSDFIWPVLPPVTDGIPNPKMALYFPILCIFSQI